MIIKEHILINEEDWNSNFIKKYLDIYNDLKLQDKLSNVENESYVTIEMNFYMNRENNELKQLLDEIKEIEKKINKKRVEN